MNNNLIKDNYSECNESIVTERTDLGGVGGLLGKKKREKKI